MIKSKLFPKKKNRKKKSSILFFLYGFDFFIAKYLKSVTIDKNMTNKWVAQCLASGQSIPQEEEIISVKVNSKNSIELFVFKITHHSLGDWQIMFVVRLLCHLLYTFNNMLWVNTPPQF